MNGNQTNLGSEAAARVFLRKSLRNIEKLLLNPVCHGMLEDLIRQQIALLEALKRERRRKTRSKAYLELRRHFLRCCEGPLGALGELPPDLLALANTMVNAFISHLAGSRRTPKIDPVRFISLQRRIFVHPKKRGPKHCATFDEAYRRFLRQESITTIAREMAPQAFAADPLNTVQKFSKAIHRRKRAARKRATH